MVKVGMFKINILEMMLLAGIRKEVKKKGKIVEDERSQLYIFLLLLFWG
jgi:hypothetical protein